MRLPGRHAHRPEAIQIEQKRFGYFPQVFRWHGRQYDVQAVERCWTVTKQVPRLCFRVRCHEGRFDIYQDVRGNTWHLSPV